MRECSVELEKQILNLLANNSRDALLNMPHILITSSVHLTSLVLLAQRASKRDTSKTKRGSYADK